MRQSTPNKNYNKSRTKTLWPNDHPFALTLSHDVDRVAKQWWHFAYYIFQAIRHRQPAEIRQHIRSFRGMLRRDDPYWNFQRIMTLEGELGVRSTFFFLNERGQASLLSPRSMMLFWGCYAIADKSIQKVIQALDDGGWEIGLHGSYSSYQDEALLRQEKEQLEAILGKPVTGSRQHYLNLTIPETWHAHTRIGLSYDSTLGFADRIDFRWGICHPFYPKDPLNGEIIPLLQIPIGIMDGPLMRRQNSWQVALSFIDQVEQEQGILTLDWHQRVFNPWEYHPWQKMYARIIQECQRRGAWVVPLREAAGWWSAEKA